MYRLWAIEGDENIKKILSFFTADDCMVIEPDIDQYRELKLRLLNGTHTLSCGIAFLSGIDSVKNAMDNKTMEAYISGVMKKEIGPSIPYDIDNSVIQDFIAKVLDRFRNPHINHHWKNITLNYSSKMKMRCVPLLVNYYKKNDTAPELFALGFAAYLYFMKPVRQIGNEYFGECNGQEYLIEDEMAGEFHKMWMNQTTDKLVEVVLKNALLWEQDLSMLPGFRQSVSDKLNTIINKGMRGAIENIYPGKSMCDE